MGATHELTGLWQGTIEFASQRRTLQVEICSTEDGFTGRWQGGWPDADGSMEVLTSDVGVHLRTPDLSLVHTGTVGDELRGRIDALYGTDTTDATFRLRRDDVAFKPYAHPRLDRDLLPVTSPVVTPPADLGDGWEIGRLPAGAAHTVEDLVSEVLQDTHQVCDGFLVVHGGRIVAEEHFYGTTVDDLHAQQSVTKSVTSLLYGIALGRGEVPPVDTRVVDLYADYPDTLWVKENAAVTVHHVLSMSAGLEWDERTANYTDERNSHVGMNRSEDWVRHILDRPLVLAPGELFNYCSGLSIVLGDILRRHVGDVAAYAERHLFGPLGIERYHWTRIATGGHQTGGGLVLRQRDMAKLGQLMLDDGLWRGRPVVPASWVTESLTEHARSLEPHERYGYQWWLTEDKGVDVWSARGWGGQRILVNRELDTVVVHTGSDYERAGVDDLERRTAALMFSGGHNAEPAADHPPTDPDR